MFQDINFMKLQKKLRDNKQFSAQIYVCSNVFECRLFEFQLNAKGELVEQQQPKPIVMSSSELAAWIES